MNWPYGDDEPKLRICGNCVHACPSFNLLHCRRQLKPKAHTETCEAWVTEKSTYCHKCYSDYTQCICELYDD